MKWFAEFNPAPAFALAGARPHLAAIFIVFEQDDIAAINADPMAAELLHAYGVSLYVWLCLTDLLVAQKGIVVNACDLRTTRDSRNMIRNAHEIRGNPQIFGPQPEKTYPQEVFCITVWNTSETQSWVASRAMAYPQL